MATYRELLEQAGARHGIPEGLMTQLGGKESSYRPNAVSSKGARGLTQVMPDTYRGMGYTDEQMQNPEYQADAGARYLSQMYQRFGNWRDALQAYHDGPGNVEKAKRGEYTPGPEGRQYVDNRFSQWTGDPSTNNDVEQRATSAKLHPQQDPDNPFAQIESQATGNPVESHVQDDPNNPFAQIEQQSETTQQPAQQQTQQPQQGQQQEQGFMSDLGNAALDVGKGITQAGVGILNIPSEMADAVSSAGVWALNKMGIGDGTYQPAPRVTLPDSMKPKTTGGQITGEVLPYLLPTGLESAAVKGAGLAERAGTKFAQMLTENVPGALAQSSGEGQQEDLAKNLAIGTAGSGVAHAASAVAGKVAGPIVKSAREWLSPTQKVVSDADSVARVGESTSQGAQESAAASVGKAAERADYDKLATEIKPDESILKAARDLDMEDSLLPSHYSRSQTYRAVEQAVKSVPASQLRAKEYETINKLAQKADDMIGLAGGTTNKVGLSEKFKSESQRMIDDLAGKSDAIYNEIGSSIPKSTKMSAENTVSMLLAKAKSVGGVEHLSSAEKKVLNAFQEKSEYAPNALMQRSWQPTRQPTYGYVDNVRKQIGAAINKNQGPFKDQTTAELKQLYASITNDQEKVAQQFGMGDKWGVAKGLVSQRKQLEDHMVSALGKDLSGTFANKLSPAVQNLRKGNVQAFDKLIAATPQHMRQEVVASALNDVFTLGSRKEKQLNIPGFVDWYEGARKSGALNRVMKYLPKEYRRNLSNIYKVSSGIRRANEESISTGRLVTAMDSMNNVMSHLHGAAAKGAAVAGGSLGAMIGGGPIGAAFGAGIGGALGHAANSAINRPARSLAADALLSNPRFQEAILKASIKNQSSINRSIEKAPEWKRFAGYLSSEEAREIGRLGIIGWLNSDE
ncbi:lytic transglycosylase domain-containing protein [Klebsiella aerogenes]